MSIYDQIQTYTDLGKVIKEFNKQVPLKHKIRLDLFTSEGVLFSLDEEFAILIQYNGNIRITHEGEASWEGGCYEEQSSEINFKELTL